MMKKKNKDWLIWQQHNKEEKERWLQRQWKILTVLLFAAVWPSRVDAMFASMPPSVQRPSLAVWPSRVVDAMLCFASAAIFGSLASSEVNAILRLGAIFSLVFPSWSYALLCGNHLWRFSDRLRFCLLELMLCFASAAFFGLALMAILTYYRWL